MKPLFVFDFFKTIIVEWGDFLATKFGNIIYLYIIILFLVFLFYLVAKHLFKIRIEKNISFEIVLILVLIFVLIIPYKKGENLIQLKQFGYKLVNSIDKYELENNELPKSIKFLYPQYIDSDELNLANKVVKYDVFNSNSLKREFYTLTIYEDFMGFYFLSYQRNEKYFIFTDE